jgi:hypothetical protein
MSGNLQTRYWGVLYERFHIVKEFHFNANPFLPILFILIASPHSPGIQSFFLRPSHIRPAFVRKLSSLFLLLAFNISCGDLYPVRTSNART